MRGQTKKLLGRTKIVLKSMCEVIRIAEIFFKWIERDNHYVNILTCISIIESGRGATYSSAQGSGYASQ